jgi:hypothetical protein
VEDDKHNAIKKGEKYEKSVIAEMKGGRENKREIIPWKVAIPDWLVGKEKGGDPLISPSVVVVFIISLIAYASTL